MQRQLSKENNMKKNTRKQRGTCSTVARDTQQHKRTLTSSRRGCAFGTLNEATAEVTGRQPTAKAAGSVTPVVTRRQG